MKVLKVEPYIEPYEIEIPEGLASLQNQVEGYIEVLYPSEDRIGIICNEEGKLNRMELNRSVFDDAGNRLDIIAGPFLVVGLGEENFTSLPDDMLQKYKEQFKDAEMFGMNIYTRELVSLKVEARPAGLAKASLEKAQENHAER